MDSPRRAPGKGVDRTVAEIEKLARQRENRRKSQQEFKKKRDHEIRRNERKGRPGDVDFQRMIKQFRKHEMARPRAHAATGDLKINVAVRKRPVSEREVARKDHDAVSCSNPRVYVHNSKLKVDGITKYLDNVNFEVDHAFHESVPNEEVYLHTAQPLVDFALRGGRATCFAYGQTGSGKTFTMAGVQALAARDVFRHVDAEALRGEPLEVHCAFFELYGGRCIDLLGGRSICPVREDSKGRVHVEGLREEVVSDEQEMLQLIERGNAARTTHATQMNSDSSRSHAICQIALRRVSARAGAEPFGKLSLIDLAGSERGQDTTHHNKQRRAESAEINKSLLALKECVRALDANAAHVPFRGSKLTMLLKDSFSRDSRTTMIVCISPVSSSSDHTLNTLRYADRVKEKPVRASGSPGHDDEDNVEIRPDLCFSDDDDDDDIAMRDDLADDDDDDGGAGVDNVDDDEHEEEMASAARGRRRGQPRERDRSHTAPSDDDSDDSEPELPLSARIPPPDLRKPIKQQQQQQQRQPIKQPPRKKPARLNEPEPQQQPQPPPRSRQPDPLPSPAPAPAPASSAPRQQWARPSAAREPLQPAARQQGDYQDVVKELVDMEEDVLSAHMAAIQRNADMLSEEGALLRLVQGEDVVEYDIDAYAAQLDVIVAAKLKMFADLQLKLRDFRRRLQADGGR